MLRSFENSWMRRLGAAGGGVLFALPAATCLAIMRGNFSLDAVTTFLVAGACGIGGVIGWGVVFFVQQQYSQSWSESTPASGASNQSNTLIVFACPYCGAQTEVDDVYLGQTGPCYCCGKSVTVPRDAKDGVAVHTPPSGSQIPTAVIVTIACLAIVGVMGLFGLTAFLVRPMMGAISVTTQRAVCESNLNQIALAMQSYHDSHGCYPPAYIPDSNGKPMHSWRVLILPDLGCDWLYEQYDFSQPWNSEQNLIVADQMPPVFACPDDQTAQINGETSYLVIVGSETMFPGPKTITNKQVLDGLANTAMVVEVPASQVTWTQPTDLEAKQMVFEVNGPYGTEIGSYHRGGAVYVTADGATHFLPDDTLPEHVAALATINGKEPISPSVLESNRP